MAYTLDELGLGRVDLFAAVWSVFSLAITVYGLIVYIGDKRLPTFMTNAYKFGKLLQEGSTPTWVNSGFARYFYVPKRSFAHFYIFAFTTLLITQSIFMFVPETHEPIFQMMRLIFGNHFKPSSSGDWTMGHLLMFLCLTVHFMRRIYESRFISVYSSSKINLIHYGTGLAFYASTCLAFLKIRCEASPATILNFTLLPAFSVTLFLWASFLQLRTHIGLANLRIQRDSNGRPIPESKKKLKERHFLPKSGWFDLVSCPHYFAEILIYFAFYVMSHGDNSWFILFSWVVANQVIAGLMTHQWYQDKFKEDFPPNRKAIIPYLL